MKIYNILVTASNEKKKNSYAIVIVVIITFYLIPPKLAIISTLVFIQKRKEIRVIKTFSKK